MKPANVKVKSDGTVKVLDFGVAKAFQADLSNATTAAAGTGAIVGTPGYMAPSRPGGSRDYENPKQYSEGTIHVLVNGALAIRDGLATGILAGTPLLRTGEAMKH